MKNFRFILFTPGGESPHHIEFNGRALKFVLAAVVLFLMVNLVLLVWNIFHLASSAELTKLRMDKVRLERKIYEINRYVDSLSSELCEISRMNEELYSSVGIPKPEYRYAVGGRGLIDIDGSPLQGTVFFIDSLRFVLRQEKKALESVSNELKSREKILRHTPSIKPMRGFISSGFGMRIDPLTGTKKMHEGVDICAPKGTPVRASADGRVKFAGWERGFGKVVVIDHIWFETRYAHLDEILVRVGQKVKRGDIIGKCGRTGRTTGTHLHYEVRVAGKPVDPMNYILPERICVD